MLGVCRQCGGLLQQAEQGLLAVGWAASAGRVESRLNELRQGSPVTYTYLSKLLSLLREKLRHFA